jgi:hypothetical protein
VIQRRGHGPRGLADSDDRSRLLVSHDTAREGRGDETHRIDGVHRLTKYVVEISPKP